MNRRIVYIFLGALVILNLIVWGVVLLKKSNPKKETVRQDPYIDINVDGVTLPSFKIGNDGKGNGLSSEDLSAKLNILIFFSFEDCATCLFEAEFWGLAAKLYPEDVKVFGIVDEKNDEYISDFIAEYGLTFPIIIDESEVLKKRLLSAADAVEAGIVTPFKIFIGNGVIFYVEGAKKTREEQEGFPDRVLKFLIKLQKQKIDV